VSWSDHFFPHTPGHTALFLLRAFGPQQDYPKTLYFYPNEGFQIPHGIYFTASRKAIIHWSTLHVNGFFVNMHPGYLQNPASLSLSQKVLCLDLSHDVQPRGKLLLNFGVLPPEILKTLRCPYSLKPIYSLTFLESLKSYLKYFKSGVKSLNPTLNP